MRRALNVAVAVLLGIASLSLLLALASASAGKTTRAATSELTWRRPMPVDHFAPASDTEAVYDVQCPSTSLCVAVDDQGNLLTSTDPSGGPGSWRLTVPSSGVVGQRPLPVLQLISCPTVSLCVAGGPNDRVLVSTHPAGRPSAWKAFDLRGSNQILDVSCPNSHRCFAVDRAGNLLSSVDPAGGARAWTVRPMFSPGYEAPTSLSCPSGNFCAAVDETDRTVHLVTSTDPTGGPEAWRSQLVDHATDCGRRTCFLNAVSCPSAQFCVAFDGSNVFSSTAPTTTAWTKTRLKGRQAAGVGVSCNSRELCLAFDSDGTVFTSSNPTGGTAAWKRAQIGHPDSSSYSGFSSVACPASNLCVGSTFLGRVLTARAPSRGRWRVTFSDAFNAIHGISCPGRHLCVAVDDGGNVLSSTDPTADRPEAWKGTRIDRPTRNPYETGLVGISCPSVNMCAVWDARDRIFTSRDPAGGRSRWKLLRRGPPMANRLDRDVLDCPTARLCLAVDYIGQLWFTTKPLDAAAPWKRFRIDRTKSGGAPGLESIGCFRASLCVAGDLYGHVLVSTRPTRGPQTWKRFRLEGPSPGGSYCDGPCTPSLWTVSCPSTGLCLLDDGNGYLFSSTNPDAGRTDWKYVGGLSPNVSCASSTLCFTFGISGSRFQLYTSTNPASGVWQAAYLSAQNLQTVIEGVACVPHTLTCIGVDDHGDVFISR